MFELKSITPRVRSFPLVTEKGMIYRWNIPKTGCSRKIIYGSFSPGMATLEGKQEVDLGKGYRESSRQGEIVCLRGLKFCGPQNVSSCKDQCSPSSHTRQTS